MALSNFQLFVRRSIKRVLYSQMFLSEAIKIAMGKGRPLIPFKVEGDPPSVYYNFEIRADRLQALRQHLSLPGDFDLCPIRCLEDDTPYYCLTLNVYRVSGVTTGTRAEWSVYVKDDQGKPRYMVVEARQDGYSMDPIDIITVKSRVEHGREENCVRTVLGEEGSAFVARFNLPVENGAAAPKAHTEWVEANDHIYWRNGIRDGTFYRCSLAHARLAVAEPSQVELKDDTSWADFVQTGARQVIAFRDPIEFVIAPWENI